MDNKEIESTVQNVRRYFDHDAEKQILKEKSHNGVSRVQFG